MKNDPFAGLGGLDQKLFSPPSPAGPTRQERVKSEAGRPVERKKERSDSRPNVRTYPGTSETTAAETWRRSSVRTEGRTTERRPYDFYQDQLLWLNRMKVEIQEKYQRKVTASAMVQLALDLFIADYRARGRRSQLITNLVFREPASEHVGQATEELADGGTPERAGGGA